MNFSDLCDEGYEYRHGSDNTDVVGSKLNCQIKGWEPPAITTTTEKDDETTVAPTTSSNNEITTEISLTTTISSEVSTITNPGLTDPSLDSTDKILIGVFVPVGILAGVGVAYFVYSKCFKATASVAPTDDTEIDLEDQNDPNTLMEQSANDKDHLTEEHDPAVNVVIEKD